ncbi:MAG: O-antigen ligase family protein [Paludibacteraceae bacterium]|nr:O-antigen ligase family protein [Paludibacteraceae bacterium]
MDRIFDIMPFGNDSYLWSIGFVVLSLLVSAWPKLQIEDKRDYLFYVPLAAFIAATLHSVRIGIDVGTTFIIAAGLYALWKRRVYRPRLYMWFLAAYFFSLVLSLLWSSNIIEGWYIVRRSLPLITFSAAWCMFRPTQDEWDRLLLVYFRAAFLFIIFSILTSFYISYVEGFSWWEFVSFKKHHIHGGYECFKMIYSWTHYYHPSYNAYCLVTGLICGQYLLFKKHISYIEAGLYVVSLFLLLILTQSRIGIVMFAITAPIAATAFIKSPKWKKLYSYAVGAMMTILLICWIQINTVFSIDPAREHIYQVTVKMIQEHPILGVGVGSLAQTLQQDPVCMLHQYGNPHNQIMGDWMQGGLISLITMLLMMGYFLYYAIRYKNLELLLFVIITLLFMQIEMPFDIIKGVTTFVAFVHLFCHKPNDRYNARYDSM